MQTDVVSLRHYHMRAQALVEQNHVMRSAISSDGGCVSLSSR